MRKSSAGYKIPKKRVLLILPECDYEALKEMASHERTSVNALMRGFFFDAIQDWKESGIKEDKKDW